MAPVSFQRDILSGDPEGSCFFWGGSAPAIALLDEIVRIEASVLFGIWREGM